MAVLTRSDDLRAHFFLLSLAWHCYSFSGIAMTSHDDHWWRSGDRFWAAWGEVGGVRYLAARWTVMMMNLYDAFPDGFSLDALHVERSYVTLTEPFGILA